jgi:hypothetical protein
LLFLIIQSAANAQHVKPATLIKMPPTSIERQRTTPYPGVIYLPMPFSSAEWKDTSQLADISSPEQIYAIHLVYTRFREVDSFNQPKLNFKRYENLFALYPKAFSNEEIEWKAVEQQQAKRKEDASLLFHGFIIYLKTAPAKERMDKEMKMIRTIINSYSDTLVWIPEKIEWKVKRTKIETGYFLPANKKKRKEGVKYSSSFIGIREKEYRYKKDSTIKRKSGGYYLKKGSFDTLNFKNINEFRMLTRRKWSGKTAVITDVTGSMSPYATQVMLWLKYSPEILKQGRFVFFNDGDGKPDPLKRLGNTGGIHIAATDNYDSVFNVMENTMRKGTGGDIPENNLEAAIAALRRWPDTDTLLLIADNDAAVKDISLLNKINKPISVMVCGSGEVIHKDYIEIARTTGGRLFVMNTELDNLKKLPNGGIVYLAGKKYEFKNGSLVRKRD